MPKKLTDIQLWAADRSAEIAIPGGDGVLDYLVKNPFIREKLGEEHQLTLEVKSGTTLAIAKKGDDHELSQGKILRFVYDDSSIFEWRITQGSRDFSGSQDVMIKAKPIYTDLSRRIVRRTLSTGATRSSLSFYGQSVETVLTKLLSSDYNCPDYITLGTISNDVKKVEINEVLVDRTVNITLNAEYLMSAIAKVCELAGAEWDASYDDINDVYELNFVKSGELGGGESEADDRPITMGGNRSNRLDMVRRDEDENYFSRIVPTAGQSNEVIGIGDVSFKVKGTANLSNAEYGDYADIYLSEDLILKDGYGTISGEDVYFGIEGDYQQVIDTFSDGNRVRVYGNASGLHARTFKIGAAKDELIFLEDPEAVAEVGAIEEKYVRTDIVPYENLAEEFGISVALSEWSSGLPVGFAKIDGAETVAEETSEVYTLHGDKAAKVSCGAEQGLETIGMNISPEELSPYFSISAYLRCESGAVRVELVDSANNVYPANEVAETSIDVTRVIQIGGMELPDDTVKIRFVAQVTGTVFYLDALTFTQSATPINFAPLMGKKALWLEASRHLKKFSGDRPDVWTGSVIDESWFSDVAGAKEISVGSYVTVQEDYNDGTGTFDTEQVLRVIEVSYHESPEDGRYKKTVRLSESKSLLANVLNENYVRNQSLQNVQSVGATPSRPIFDEEADELYLKKSENLGDVQSAALSRVNIGLGPDDEPQFAGATIGGFVVEDEIQEIKTDVIDNHLSVEALWDATVKKGQSLQVQGGDGIGVDDETERLLDENLSWQLSLLYNATNLKMTAGELNTIQDIDAGADVDFNSLTLGSQFDLGDIRITNGIIEALTGNITLRALNGDIIFNGDTIQADHEITTADTIIVLNDDEPGDGVTAGFSGIQVYRGGGASYPDYLIGFRESDDQLVLGEFVDAGGGIPDPSGLQALLTRENVPTDKALFYWNASMMRGDSISELLYTGSAFTTAIPFQTDDYSLTTDFSGVGWQGTDDGDFNMRNLVVRESARFRELILDQLGVIAGSDLRSVARGKILSVDAGNNKVRLENPRNISATSFIADDFFWIKEADVDGGSFLDLKGQVTAVTVTTSGDEEVIELTLDTTVAGGTHSGGSTDLSNLTAGSVIVQRGHPTDDDRQALIYTTVSDSDAPVQKYFTGIDSLTAFDSVANITTQIGNLEGLTPTYANVTGEGFYSSKAFLTDEVLIGDLDKVSNYLEYASGELSANLKSLLLTINDTAENVSTAVQEIRSDLIDIYLSSEGAYSGIQFLAGQLILTTNLDGKVSLLRLDSTGEESVIDIAADQINIDGTTTFSSGYDPSTKETPLGAQNKVNSLQTDIDAILDDAVANGTTIISGGFIETSLIDVDDLFAQTITIGASGLIQGSNWVIDEDKWVHPSLGQLILGQLEYATAGLNTTTSDPNNQEYGVEAEISAAGNAQADRNKINISFLKRTGVDHIRLKFRAKKDNDLGSDPNNSAENKIWLEWRDPFSGTATRFTEEVDITTTSNSTYELEVDISSLTDDEIYYLEVVCYAEVTQDSGSETIYARTYITNQTVIETFTE